MSVLWVDPDSPGAERRHAVGRAWSLAFDGHRTIEALGRPRLRLQGARPGPTRIGGREPVGGMVAPWTMPPTPRPEASTSAT